ncbi:aconitase X [Pusillimonas sp. SM2304]|uniref:aconitase X n=1 Tax=Pusillimonas sp. SM2304 TaxID=3073241 RepID=UPI00287452B7|nr:aconitase X [Pusillimonas sp. SM2304]MDS1138996.1 aconitase X [Pusillimonas sp. SM2304]
MLNGGMGAAAQEMMSILLAAGRAVGAADFVPIRSAHVGLSFTSLGPAGVRWLEKLAASGARVRVLTTTNVLSAERHSGKTSGSADDEMQGRALKALLRMGALDSCSCNPFTQGHLPEPGSCVAWSESATAPYVNSVLGARTNREGVTALASALTGVTPNYGMHILSNRRARLAMHVRAELSELHRFHLLGAVLARRCGGRIPVITGIPPDTDAVSLYGLCAGFASYCSLSMFHLVGISPEAPTFEAAISLGLADDTELTEIEAMEIRDDDIEQQRLEINQHSEKRSADIAVIGCPHASLSQLREITALVDGESVRADKVFLVHTNAEVSAEAERQGLLPLLRAAGVIVTRDTCLYVSLDRYPQGSRVLSNSVKMVQLMAARGYDAAIASTRDCVRAMIQR